MKFPCRAFVQPVVSDTLVSFVWSYLDSGPSTTQMQVLESEFYGWSIMSGFAYLVFFSALTQANNQSLILSILNAVAKKRFNLYLI